MWKALSSWEPPEKKAKGRGGVDDSEDEVSCCFTNSLYCHYGLLITMMVYRKQAVIFHLISASNGDIPGVNSLLSLSDASVKRKKGSSSNGQKRYAMYRFPATR